METKELDKVLIAFIEENTLAVILALVAVFLVQLIWWVSKSPKSLLAQEGFHSLPLIKKEDVNHNTLFLRFGLEDKRQQLGLPVGQHLVFRMSPGGDQLPVSRPYTPVSNGEAKGHVDFVIKVYPKGIMTQHLNQLKIGQRMSMKGPKGKFVYKRNMKKSIGMLAGGTGITPMYQVLNHILKDPKDRTKISLIYANIAPADILLRQNLDGLAAKYSTRFDIYYVVEKSAPVGWKYGVGYISRDMIKEHCPAAGDDTLLLWCGPPPMVEAMKKLSEEIGYAPECTFGF